MENEPNNNVDNPVNTSVEVTDDNINVNVEITESEPEVIVKTTTETDILLTALNVKMNRIAKRLENVEDALNLKDRKGRLEIVMDKITSQGIVLIIAIIIIGVTFCGALFIYDLPTAISALGALGLLTTLVAVYFGLEARKHIEKEVKEEIK